MINYRIQEGKVLPYLPKYCTVDKHNGDTFASLVLFEFNDTKVVGVNWPGHTNFSEINLRLYVTHQRDKELKRGVVFVKELVPKRTIATIARLFYSEPYEAVAINREEQKENGLRKIEYNWAQHTVGVTTDNQWIYPDEGSHEEFIIEHYWGYTKLSNDRVNEYEVVHPKWRTGQISLETYEVDFGKQYGQDWSFLNGKSPYSSFIAEGSSVEVMTKGKIR